MIRKAFSIALGFMAANMIFNFIDGHYFLAAGHAVVVGIMLFAIATDEEGNEQNG